MSNHLAFDLSFALLSTFYPFLRHQVTSHLLNCFLKCLPMSFLIGVLLLQQRNKQQNNGYAKNILLGLVCSTVGDAFLVYTDLCSHSLLGGVGAFGVAHIFYISAFGLRPFKISGAAIVVTIQLVAFAILQEELKKMGTIYLVVVPVYMGLLLTMAWRATAQTDSKTKSSSNSLLRKVGGISFLVSDTILSLTEMTGLISAKLVPPQVSTILILSTYYLSQFCFARTALSENTKRKSIKKRQ